MAEPGAMAQPTPRLMIREMVLENFKSYAGKQHVGPFHKVRGCCKEVLHRHVQPVLPEPC